MTEVAPGDIFIHVRIVLGTVVGLGLTRILLGFAGLVQQSDRTRLSLPHMLWCLSVLIELVLFWWWEFELAAIQEWSFGLFAFLLSYAFTLVLMAALLFPDRLDGFRNYEDFFLKRRAWFFGLFAATFFFDVCDTLIKGPPYFDETGISYLIQVPFGLVLATVGMLNTGQRVQLAIVLLHLCYQAYWITVLFHTPI